MVRKRDVRLNEDEDIMKQYLTYCSQGKFSSEKLSVGIRHLSSDLTLVT